jgi:hypothetical protein
MGKFCLCRYRIFFPNLLLGLTMQTYIHNFDFLMRKDVVLIFNIT